MRPLRVLLVSGFFESQLVSFREYAYSKELADLGHEVTLMCGDQSYIWSKSRVRLPVTDPAKDDRDLRGVDRRAAAAAAGLLPR